MNFWSLINLGPHLLFSSIIVNEIIWTLFFFHAKCTDKIITVYLIYFWQH